jgi:hypothetical protein
VGAALWVTLTHPCCDVPVYRREIENRGARFLHHDGGEEDSTARLDAHLESA